MIRFLRESVKEFDHVVWPTRRETVRYFGIVLSTIAVFALFLFIVGMTFSTSLFAIRSVVAPSAPAASSAAPQTSTSEVDLGALLGSGAQSSGSTAASASGSAK